MAPDAAVQFTWIFGPVVVESRTPVVFDTLSSSLSVIVAFVTLTAMAGVSMVADTVMLRESGLVWLTSSSTAVSVAVPLVLPAAMLIVVEESVCVAFAPVTGVGSVTVTSCSHAFVSVAVIVDVVTRLSVVSARSHIVVGLAVIVTVLRCFVSVCPPKSSTGYCDDVPKSHGSSLPVCPSTSTSQLA